MAGNDVNSDDAVNVLRRANRMMARQLGEAWYRQLLAVLGELGYELVPVGEVRQVREERDLFRDQAIPEAAQIMNALTAERNRLRAVVDAAVAFAEVAERAGPHADPMAQAEEYVATRRALIQAVSALDGSPDA